MNTHDFKNYIQNPESLNKDSSENLELLSQEFPFCSTIHTLLSKNHDILDTAKKNNFLKKAAIYSGNRKKLYRFMHNLPEEIIVEQHTPAFRLIILLTNTL